MLKGYLKDYLGNCRKVIIDDAGGVLLPVNQIDDEFSFSLAIELLKQGKKIARKGWNGKTQYIELAKSISYVNANNEVVNAEHNSIGNKTIAFVGTSGVQIGWLASQADMLAEDWVIAE